MTDEGFLKSRLVRRHVTVPSQRGPSSRRSRSATNRRETRMPIIGIDEDAQLDSPFLHPSTRKGKERGRARERHTARAPGRRRQRSCGLPVSCHFIAPRRVADGRFTSSALGFGIPSRNPTSGSLSGGKEEPKRQTGKTTGGGRRLQQAGTVHAAKLSDGSYKEPLRRRTIGCFFTRDTLGITCWGRDMRTWRRRARVRVSRR